MDTVKRRGRMVAGMTRWRPGGGGLGGRMAASLGGTCGKSGCQNSPIIGLLMQRRFLWGAVGSRSFVLITYSFASYLLILSNLYDIV